MSAAIGLAWFPAGEYEEAIARWPGFAEDFSEESHADYCRWLERELLRMTSSGVSVRGVVPIQLHQHLPGCERQDVEPELGSSRASYSAELVRQGRFIACPPRRNDPCWCGSQRKYKHCCDTVEYRPDDDA